MCISEPWPPMALVCHCSFLEQCLIDTDQCRWGTSSQELQFWRCSPPSRHHSSTLVKSQIPTFAHFSCFSHQLWEENVAPWYIPPTNRCHDDEMISDIHVTCQLSECLIGVHIHVYLLEFSFIEFVGLLVELIGAIMLPNVEQKSYLNSTLPWCVECSACCVLNTNKIKACLQNFDFFFRAPQSIGNIICTEFNQDPLNVCQWGTFKILLTTFDLIQFIIIITFICIASLKTRLQSA